jgi:hypothetical protein
MGVKMCYRYNTRKKQKSNTIEFIKKSKEIHGNKYDYSLVKYESNYSKVCIICPTHGIFYQTPSDHKNNRGCPKCGLISNSKKQSLGIQNFTIISNEIHGNKYDYSLVEYINYSSTIKIICPEHGVFEQMAGNHYYRGCGCPKCNNTQLFKDKYLYVFYDKEYNIMKIGVSQNPEQRLKKYQMVN